MQPRTSLQVTHLQKHAGQYVLIRNWSSFLGFQYLWFVRVLFSMTHILLQNLQLLSYPSPLHIASIFFKIFLSRIVSGDKSPNGSNNEKTTLRKSRWENPSTGLSFIWHTAKVSELVLQLSPKTDASFSSAFSDNSSTLLWNFVNLKPPLDKISTTCFLRFSVSSWAFDVEIEIIPSQLIRQLM